MDTQELIDFVQSNDVATRFFDDLAQREKNYRITTVDQAKIIVGGGVKRSQIISMFKEMDALNLGVFRMGRRGAKSRFEWSVSMIDAGKATTGEAEVIEELDALEPETIEELEHDVDVLEHKFHLRKGMDPIVITLPSDLTQFEAKRLSQFLRCLPFDLDKDDDDWEFQ
ncbi:MAG: hypothetical protein WCZ66_12095 [Sphingomonadaceae bacterium]